MRYAAKWPQYAKQWDSMVIKKNRVTEFTEDAKKILAHKDIYQEIEGITATDQKGKNGEGVPWPLIGLTHLRESSLDFDTYLGNGDPLNRKTRDVPANRGPFKNFVDGAVDALNVDGLSDIIDWRLEKILYYCEIFNGTGYDGRGKPSPYVWGGTNIQVIGKYVSDRKWSGTKWDTQPGCAPTLYMLMKLDSSIQFIRES